MWTADYALVEYGTGAVMAVPTHDERDFAFAKKYHLPMKVVIGEDKPLETAYTDEGLLVNSGEFNGMKNTEAKKLLHKKQLKKVLESSKHNTDFVTG